MGIDINSLKIGSRLQLRKLHPCGSEESEIIYVGANIKIKCVKCNRFVSFPRSKATKRIKSLLQNEL